ncbi:MAG: Ppx/GppA phosphatase family protein [Actinomycetota bacterium]
MGTNSTRLLVADCDGSATTTINRRMVITRLGEGVDEEHALREEAMDRTVAVLETYAGVIRDLEPAGVAVVATSVLRDCWNADAFLDRAEATLGTRPRVISGQEEATLSFIGAVSGLTKMGVRRDSSHPGSGSDTDAEGPAGLVLVFDIGGGSTEIVLGDPASPPDLLAGEAAGQVGLRLASVDVGCVRMSERFLASDPPSPIAIGRMESELVSKLKPVLEPIRVAKPALGIGLAGTVTTVSGIRMGLEAYDTERIHHSRLTRSDVEHVFRELAFLTVEERRERMKLEPGRADVIVGGAAVLRAVMDLAGLDEILVSEKDILDGLVLELYHRMSK